jgi:hypothetical protein
MEYARREDGKLRTFRCEPHMYIQLGARKYFFVLFCNLLS